MGKHSHNFIDLTGQVFGRLTIIKQVPNIKPKHSRWLCLCECGRKVETNGTNLRQGNTRSCGCLKREASIATGKRNATHGMTNSKEYRTWRQMMWRCLNPQSADYDLYGKRGIRVCERWRNDFMAFYSDMGPKPSPEHSIDRINGNGHYSCGQCQECIDQGWEMNCRWATRSQQGRNKANNAFLTYNDEIRCAAEWAEITGIPAYIIRQRMARGLPAGKVLSHDKYNQKLITFNGESKSMSQWSRELDIPCSTIHYRIKRQWPIEKIMAAT